MEEKGLKNYSLIAFGGRKFYLPLNAYKVYFSNDELDIDFQEDVDAYGIVNGIRCYDVISYNKKTDTVTTCIKEYILNGKQCSNTIPSPHVSFNYEDQQICIITGQMVTPWRHYEELATAFLSEHPQIDLHIYNFLRIHPECFGNSAERSDDLCNYVGAWLDLHTILQSVENDPEAQEDALLHGVVCPLCMDNEVFQQFVEEEAPYLKGI